MIKPPYPVIAAMERDGDYPVAKLHHLHLQPNPRFSDRTLNSSSSISSSISAFSECNSDRSTDFFPSSPSRSNSTATSSSAPPRHHRLVPSYSDDRVRALVSDLDSDDAEAQRAAVTELRLLAKDSMDNRVKIARAGAVLPLVGLLSSSDPYVMEQAVTAVLNLSLCEENKNVIARAGAIFPMVQALRTGSGTGPACRENAAIALTRLSQVEEHRAAIGRAGAMPLLVSLLQTAGPRGKKDALTAIFALCSGGVSSSSSSNPPVALPQSCKENRVRAAKAGVVAPVLELMADSESGLVDKAAFVLATIAGIPEARQAVAEESGVAVLVELIESGSSRQKEVAADVLLTVCEESAECRALAVAEQAVPALVSLKESGRPKAKKKAEMLVELLRQPRPVANGVGGERRRGSDKAAGSSSRGGAGSSSSRVWGEYSYSF